MPIKLTTTTDSYKGGGKSKRIHRANQEIIINVFLESLLSESFPSLGVTVHLTSLGCPPTLCSSLDLLWGQFRFYSGPTPVCSCLQCPQLSELTCFLLWELSMSSYIFHRHRVCLVDRVDLICSLYSWWEGFVSSSLDTLPLGFNCGFISISTCMSSTEVLLLRLLCRAWICPCKDQVWRWCSCLGCRISGNIRNWWWLGRVGSWGSRKYGALEGYGNQCWPIISSILAWRMPL